MHANIQIGRCGLLSLLLSSVAVIISVGMGAATAKAELLGYDSFESYNAGASLSGGSGGQGWTGDWQVGNAYTDNLTIVDTNLRYEGGDFVVDGGTRAMQITGGIGGTPAVAQRSFASTGDTVYMTMLFQTTTASGTSDDDFVQMGVDNRFDHPRASIGHRKNNAVDDHDFFARTSSNHNKSTFSDGAGADVLTHFLVARITKIQGNQYNQVELWIDPTSLDLGAADAIQTHATGLSSVDRFVTRLAFLEGGDTYLIDELRIGTDLSGVAAGGASQGIPEPAVTAWLMIGLVLMPRRRRYA